MFPLPAPFQRDAVLLLAL